MKQFTLDSNRITLKVKKSNLFARGLFYFMSAVIFTGPLIGFLISINNGEPFHIKYLLGIGLSSLLAFYILRYALWNSYGKETIVLNSTSVDYITDYKIFKDIKSFEKEVNPIYSYLEIGYIEDRMGCLVVTIGTTSINCVVKMPIDDIETLMQELTKGNSS